MSYECLQGGWGLLTRRDCTFHSQVTTDRRKSQRDQALKIMDGLSHGSAGHGPCLVSRPEEDFFKPSETFNVFILLISRNVISC